MNVLAIQSSGDETSVCVIHNENVISFRLSHERKDRPNWNEMLGKIGVGSSFKLDDIDLFSYANSSGSYTATRTVASFMKGIAVVLKKPLTLSTFFQVIPSPFHDWLSFLIKIFLPSFSQLFPLLAVSSHPH